VVGQQPGVSGTAKRLRQNRTAAPPKNVVLNIVECSQCGDRFAISHDCDTQDPVLAERQSAWLREQFVWDHIQENKHRPTITLPTSEEMK